MLGANGGGGYYTGLALGRVMQLAKESQARPSALSTRAVVWRGLIWGCFGLSRACQVECAEHPQTHLMCAPQALAAVEKGLLPPPSPLRAPSGSSHHQLPPANSSGFIYRDSRGKRLRLHLLWDPPGLPWSASPPWLETAPLGSHTHPALHRTLVEHSHPSVDSRRARGGFFSL